MRFTESGPSIPDSLLIARDQGRVIFFCGAGVSIAKAGLSDFWKLAKNVINELGLQPNSNVQKLINAANKIEEETEISNVISADKIFGLLEREFSTSDIYKAVATALTPKPDVDKTAHQTMLKLATTTDGVVRLVTTNFDRLFDMCDPQLPTFTPPQLPDLSNSNSLNGVVYLHGKVNEDNTGAENSGFVLSSSEFGAAYLANGWATSFVKAILEKYIVVFVGYSADDPPIQYLLEALSKNSNTLNDIYAFQIGSQSKASELWSHKNVKAIPFDGYEQLWNTLEKWSIRAENPDCWYQRVIETAKLGPQQLESFQRGQVAHIISYMEDIDGINELISNDPPLPASWLNVFDSKLRCKEIELLNLDSEPLNDTHTKQGVSDNSWDAFAISKYDLKQTKEINLNDFFGVSKYSKLPPRLMKLADWLSKVAKQPEAILWAIQQPNLHPEIKKRIKSQLINDKDVNSVIYDNWTCLLDFFDNYEKHNNNCYNFESEVKAEVKKTGWTNRIIREFFKYSQPYIRIYQPITTGTHLKESELSLEQLIHRDVIYPKPPLNLKVPVNFLYQVTRAIRCSLETAAELHQEIKMDCFTMCYSITPEDGNNNSKKDGLLAWVLLYITYLEELAIHSITLAQKEILLWPSDDNIVFAKLRTWALGKNNLVPNNKFNLVCSMIPNKAFWGKHNQRDLLLSIKERWNSLNKKNRLHIEKRILLGPPKENGEREEDYKQRKAHLILVRLLWLIKHNCVLRSDSSELRNKYDLDAPTLKDEDIDSAVKSYALRIGIIEENRDYSCLMGIATAEIIPTAQEILNKQYSFFTKHNPFLGLSINKPIRALSALRFNLNDNEMPAWAWDTFLNVNNPRGEFLNASNPREDKPKLMAIIMKTLCQLSSKQLAKIIEPTCDWLRISSKTLSNEYYEMFFKLIKKAIDNIHQHPSNNVDSDDIGSCHSPIFNLFHAILPEQNGQEHNKFSNERSQLQLQLIEELLKLQNNSRQQVLFNFSDNINHLFNTNAKWTEEHLLLILKKPEDSEAFFAGLLGQYITNFELFSIIRKSLLNLIESNHFKRNEDLKKVADLIFYSWQKNNDEKSECWISNQELQKLLIETNDIFRLRILFNAQSQQEWLPDFKKLLIDVWPKILKARSSDVSFELFKFALRSESDFAEIVNTIQPLLTKFDKKYNSCIYKKHFANTYPTEFISILNAVLPEDTANWPNGAGECINELGKTADLLRKNSDLSALHKTWDSKNL
ncbi:MAG: SIR2 family protein [Ferrimonas sp.]